MARIADHISGLDFDPQWSADGHSIAYMAQSQYDQHTTMFHNVIDTVTVGGSIAPLVRYPAHEGCMTTSTDPSELTFWDQIGFGRIRQTFLWSSHDHFLIYSERCIHTGLTYLNFHTGSRRAIGEWMTGATLSSDGQHLLAVDGNHLVLTCPDGTAWRLLANTTGAELPTWSPNGKFVYYVVRRTLRTLHYHDRPGNLFEIAVKSSAIVRLDVHSGVTAAIVQAPVHGFGNLSFSRDGRWLYFTQVSNSDMLYQHLVGQPHVTNALLNRFGPQVTVLRVPSTGGRVQVIAAGGGQVAVSSPVSR